MNKIPFSQENDVITPLPQGIAKTKKWIINRGKEKLFLKETFQTKNSLTKSEIDALQKQAPYFVPIIDEVVIEDKKYTLYPFIKGKKFNNTPLINVQTVATQVGQMLSSLAKIQSDLEKTNLEITKQRFLDDVEFFFANRTSPYNISKEDFVKEALICLESFSNAKQTLIHGDIKPENLIITKDKIYFVDIDEMKKGYFAFNFQFTCQMLFYKSKKYSTFFKSLIHSYFNNDIPSWFSQNYKFMLYNKFFNRARIFIEKGDKVGEMLFYKEFKHIFNLIRKKDWKIF